MFAVYIVSTIVAAAANIFSAMCDFVRYKQVSIAMARAGVPDSWMTTLGMLETAGAIGLLVGIGVPRLGTAAAIGLVLFFIGAIITHLRARDYSFGLSDRVPLAGRGRAGVGTVWRAAGVIGAGKAAGIESLTTYRK